jgi:hypothetical protein
MKTELTTMFELTDAELDAVAAGAAVAGGVVAVAVNVGPVDVDVNRSLNDVADVAINVGGTQRGNQ